MNSVIKIRNKMADEVAQKTSNVQNLIDRKNKIEEEIKELHAVLESVSKVVLFKDAS